MLDTESSPSSGGTAIFPSAQCQCTHLRPHPWPFPQSRPTAHTQWDSNISIGEGKSSVYARYDNEGTIRYIGRTDRAPEIRFHEHYKSRTSVSELTFKPLKGTLDHQGARIMEQQLINTYGLEKNGGQLFNKINSISPKYWRRFGIW